MTMFFYTLAESNDAPRYILFMNSGVKLVVENDQVVEHLQTLQAKGSEILVCGHLLKVLRPGRQAEDWHRFQHVRHQRADAHGGQGHHPVKSYRQKSWKNVSSSFFLTTISAYTFCPFRLSDRR